MMFMVYYVIVIVNDGQQLDKIKTIWSRIDMEVAS